ncbi:MAG: maleylpyruvate isomerase family mycothiol-dependent enzyme [Propionibacteriaceae bacterium]
MDEVEWSAVVQQQGAAFASLLLPSNLAAPVTSCPGWTLADLARHLGGVHRWARHAILHGPSEEPAGPEDESTLRRWFEEGLADLLGTLADARLHDPCWTFADPPTVRFWARRQAHETTLHHWDAASSLGEPTRIAEPVAEDGLDEVVTMFLPRQVRLGRLQPGAETIELVCPSGRRFIVNAAPADRSPEPDATLAGTAEALLLLLWGRTTLADPRLQLSGDAVAAATLLSKPLTP